MISIKKYLTLLLVFIVFSAKAQYAVVEADAQYELFNYKKAIVLYLKAYSKKQTLHVSERLADSYYKTNQYEEAEKWYGIASDMEGSRPENLLNYAFVLQNNSRFDQAKASFVKYAEIKKDVPALRLNTWLASCDSAKSWLANPGQEKLENLSRLNSAQSDWAAVSYQNTIVFSSERMVLHLPTVTRRSFLRFDKNFIAPNEYYSGWNGKRYLKLYTLKDDTDDSIAYFPMRVDSKYHIATSSFTKAEDEVFFTLTQIHSGMKKKAARPGTAFVELYTSRKDSSGKWTEAVAFPFNKGNEYSVIDPFISAGGDTLYFSSDMAGGKGGTDIYRTVKKSGQWQSPENLTSINTDQNERSPAVDKFGNIYFASDGWVGIGGLDIYKQLSDGTIVNLKAPVNSPRDDFAFFIDPESADLVYLSSDRTGGAGEDDVYKLSVPVLANTGKDVSAAEDKGVSKTDSSQGLEQNLQAGGTANATPDTGDRLIRLHNIYYDLDKWDIKASESTELDKLVKMMKENPDVKIRLFSHTDSRGSASYNMQLSQKRARSVILYLEKHGIDKYRLEAVGRGETMLLNQCTEGTLCSEEDHQANRRTEFEIR